MTLPLDSTPAGVVLHLKVVPGASRSRIVGLLGDRLKVAVAAPPEDGKANDAVCKLLAEALGIPARQVAVTQGHSRPQKTVTISGLPLDQIRSRLTSIS